MARALLFAALAVAPAQASQPTLFHSPSDNGVDPGALVPPLQPNGTRTLYLYLRPGGVATDNDGQLCNGGAGGLGGNGDETCGVHFEIRVDGDLSILSFTPQVGQVSSRIEPGSRTLRTALVTTAPPLSAGTTRLGTLTIQAGPVGGTAQLSKLDTVDADLDLQTGAPRTIAFVPEPAFALQLAAGICALSLLSRHRSPRRGDLLR